MSVWEDGTVAMAIPIKVVGGGAQSIVVDKVTIVGGITSQPAGALALGDMIPERLRAIEAIFKVPADGSPRDVSFSGTFKSNALSCTFSVTTRTAPAPTPPGTLAAKPAVAPKHRLTGETWPAQPPRVPRNPNAKEQTFTPPGPIRNFMTTPPTASKIAKLPGVTAPFKPPEQGAAAGVSAAIFTRNNGAGNYGITPPDPSIAATRNSGVVMISANIAVSWSKDWGATFTQVNLTGITDPADSARTTFFPAQDGGLCCDQVLTYSKKYDLFIWILQTWPKPGNLGPNRLYLAWATPSAITTDFLHAWQWIEVDSPLIGITGTDWIDYPDVTVSDENVYLSVDHAIGGSVSTRVFSRWSLGDIANNSKPSVGGAYIEIKDGGIVKGHIARESPNTMYFAALSNQSTIRVYTWADESGSVSWVDVPITSHATNHVSNAPDGVDWNSGPGNILGAVLVQPQKLCFGNPPGCDPTPRRVAWFAFRAGSNTDGTRPHPYVRAVAIDMRASKLEAEVDIWNPEFAFSMPTLTGFCAYEKCEIAVGLAVGGGGGYPQFAVGFLYDWLVYSTTSSDATQSWDCTPSGAATKSYCSRFGDYFNVTASQGPPIDGRTGYGYSALGYNVRASTAGKTCATGGCAASLQYVQFGRDGTLNPGPPPR